VISSKIPNYPFESIDHFTKTHLRPLIDVKRYPLFVRYIESLRFGVGPSIAQGKTPSTSDLVILDTPINVQGFLPYLVCEKDTYIIHLVFPYEDKSTTLSYEPEPSTPITPKVDQVKKEIKKGKPALKKAKVKEEEHTPQIKVCLLSYEHTIILNIYRQSRNGLKL
jgi:hypothetical protein